MESFPHFPRQAKKRKVRDGGAIPTAAQGDEASPTNKRKKLTLGTQTAGVEPQKPAVAAAAEAKQLADTNAIQKTAVPATAISAPVAATLETATQGGEQPQASNEAQS